MIDSGSCAMRLFCVSFSFPLCDERTKYLLVVAVIVLFPTEEGFRGSFRRCSIKKKGPKRTKLRNVCLITTLSALHRRAPSAGRLKGLTAGVPNNLGVIYSQITTEVCDSSTQYKRILHCCCINPCFKICRLYIITLCERKWK